MKKLSAHPILLAALALVWPLIHSPLQAAMIHYSYTGAWQLRPGGVNNFDLNGRSFHLEFDLDSAAVPYDTGSTPGFDDSAAYYMVNPIFSVSGVGAQVQSADRSFAIIDQYPVGDFDYLFFDTMIIGFQSFAVNTLIFSKFEFNSTAPPVFEPADVTGIGAWFIGGVQGDGIFDVVNAVAFGRLVDVPSPGGAAIGSALALGLLGFKRAPGSRHSITR